jgi:hypothetical protein
MQEFKEAAPRRSEAGVTEPYQLDFAEDRKSLLNAYSVGANDKNKICWATGKFVLRTDLSVDLTDFDFDTNDFVRCLKKLKDVETTDKIGCDIRFVGQGNR